MKRTLEITVLSCENLCVREKPVTKNAYVTVWTESIDCRSTTRMAKEGSYPSWNEKLLVDMPMHANSITFEVQTKTTMGAIQSIGVARIAISEFLGGMVPENHLQFLSYRLRDREGRKNGIINFSIRVKTAPEESCSMSVPTKGVAAAAREKKYGGVQFPSQNENDSNGVVTGIPVSWRPLGGN